MRYFLAFLVNDLTAESRVLFLSDPHTCTIQQLMARARGKVEWNDAEVTIVEIDAPPVATWELAAFMPADMPERTDGVFASSEELRFRRLLES